MSEGRGEGDTCISVYWGDWGMGEGGMETQVNVCSMSVSMCVCMCLCVCVRNA